MKNLIELIKDGYVRMIMCTVLSPKKASEFSEPERKILVRPNRWGKSEFSCVKCNKTIQMNDMDVQVTIMERDVFYDSTCPQCKAPYFTTMITRKQFGIMHPEWKIAPTKTVIAQKIF